MPNLCLVLSHAIDAAKNSIDIFRASCYLVAALHRWACLTRDEAWTLLARLAHFNDRRRYMAKFTFYTISFPPGGGKDYIITISGSVNSRNDTLCTITLHSNEMSERQMPTASDLHERSVKRRWWHQLNSNQPAYHTLYGHTPQCNNIKQSKPAVSWLTLSINTYTNDKGNVGLQPIQTVENTVRQWVARSDAWSMLASPSHESHLES